MLHYPSKNGHFYFLHGKGTTQGCRDQCQSVGGRLLIVRDEAQHQAMREVIINQWSTEWSKSLSKNCFRV